MLALVEDRCFGGRSDLRLTASASFTLPALRPSHGYVAENACWEYEGHLIPCPRCALAEAQAKIETTERDNAFLAEGRDQAFRDRDTLQATLEQARGALIDLIANTGPVYDPIGTMEARR